MEDSVVSSENKYGFSQKGYPNPFSTKSFIEFTLEEDDSINVELFNILGGLVGIMMDTLLSKGTHRITFNNPDLALGIYQCVISTGDTSISRKILLLK